MMHTVQIRFSMQTQSTFFEKKIPRRIWPNRKSVGGFKVEKDRARFLFCSDASGDRILRPLLINRSLKPQAMKGVDIDKLPVN